MVETFQQYTANSVRYRFTFIKQKVKFCGMNNTDKKGKEIDVPYVIVYEFLVLFPRGDEFYRQ